MTEINVPLVAYRCWFALVQPWSEEEERTWSVG